MAEAETTELRETPLAALHRELGARMVPFAGYSMPVQYPTGIIAEHKQVRSSAGLFDVSHMGQAVLVGPDHATTARALEALTPGDFLGLGLGRTRYTLLMTDDGGIIDDLMVTRSLATERRRHADARRQCIAKGRRLRHIFATIFRRRSGSKSLMTGP